MSYRRQGYEFEYFNPYGALSESVPDTEAGSECGALLEFVQPPPGFQYISKVFPRECSPECSIDPTDLYFGLSPSSPLLRESAVGSWSTSDTGSQRAAQTIYSPPTTYHESNDVDWSGSEEPFGSHNAIYTESMELPRSAKIAEFDNHSDQDAMVWNLETLTSNPREFYDTRAIADNLSTLTAPETATTPVETKPAATAKSAALASETKQNTRRKTRRPRKQYGHVFDDNGKEILDPVKRSRKRIAMLIEEDVLRRQIEEKERSKIAAARVERAERRARIQSSS